MAAPTVSKAKIDARYMEQVGIIDGMGITLKQLDRLTQWLALCDKLDTAPAAPVTIWKTR